MIGKMTRGTTSKLFEQEGNHNAIAELAPPGKEPCWKRILIIDDEVDIALTLKAGIDTYNKNNDANRRIEVYTYNDPLAALSEFKPHFYDLLLIDINMPNLNGFELCERMLKIDINVRVCFMTSGEVNREALGEIHPAISLGCFVKKPITMDYLVNRIKAELD
jgi:DNA-binding response OmpR family regulator